MKIIIGTKNKAKIEAVEELIQDYDFLVGSKVEGISVESGISEQPLSLEETITGAMNRARASFSNCNYSVGLESGLMQVPGTKSGYMDFCACAIYDGEEFHLGLSSAWEFPNPEVMKLILDDGLDMSQAINKVGLTNNPQIGSEEGAIGILTKGRLVRKEYTKQAILTALIHLENTI
jgi:inosine/xanthosine triphosphatase